jgi:hypothetical protein
VATAGKSGRSYDAATLTYTFVWQTKAWANTCRELQVKLTDGAESRRPFVRPGGCSEGTRPRTA